MPRGGDLHGLSGCRCPNWPALTLKVGSGYRFQRITTPPTALVIRDAAREGLSNFSVMCSHVLTPPAIRAILDGAEAEETATIEGFVGPAHVSIIIGSDPYAKFAAEYKSRW